MLVFTVSISVECDEYALGGLFIALTKGRARHASHPGSAGGQRSPSHPAATTKKGISSSGVARTEQLAVLEALHLPVSLISSSYIYKWVNTRYAAAHGKEPEEIIGRTVRSLWGKAFDQSIRRRLQQCFRGKETRDEGWMRFPALGQRYCEVVYSPYATRDEPVSSAIVITYDLTERKELEERLRQREQLAVEQIFMQRDLALRLAQIESFDQGLTLILQAALKASATESACIWLKTEPVGDLELVSSVSPSNVFPGSHGSIPAGSALWSAVMKGKSVYEPVGDQGRPAYGALIPIQREGQVVGALTVGYPDGTKIPEQGRLTLDFLSAELGTIIARMQARRQLEKEIETRREAEKALEAERLSLQEANAALKVLLKHREEDRKELEARFVANVKQLVLPHVEKLIKSRLEPQSATMVGFIQTNLREILSPFLDNLRAFNLTPRQLEIVDLIKAGRTSKDIAEALHVTKEAIDKQRFLIRKKLDLNKGKTNLRSYLLSLL